jgi:N-acetylglucosamine-6-sulfatase
VSVTSCPLPDPPRRILPQNRLLVYLLPTVVVVASVLAIVEMPPRSPHEALAAQARPNVVVIMTDDQTRESMKVMKNVKSLIGDRGVAFQRSFVNYSLCCPSRATFLTGQYMHNHQVLGNEWPNGGFDRFESLHGNNNLAVWLQRSGYYTALIGKYLNGYGKRLLIPPGWSEWYAATGADQDVYHYTMNENGRSVFYGRDPSEFKQDVLTRKAVDFVNRRAPQARPFFLWLTYTAPHWGGLPDPNPPQDCRMTATPAPRHVHAFDSEPLPRPPNFNEADVSDKPAAMRRHPLLSADQIADIQRMYRCQLESLLSVDEGVQKVVAALRANGELADTFLVYTSDNGFFNGAHRLPREKQRIYEESIRVPLIIRGPGIPEDEKVIRVTVNADLAPTIVDVANATPGLAMDGRSLIPLAQNPDLERRRGVLIEEPSFKAIRTERFMYAEHSTGEKELYDLKTDPYELQSRDKSPAYAAIRSRLATRLQKLKTCAGAGCRTQP